MITRAALDLAGIGAEVSSELIAFGVPDAGGAVILVEEWLDQARALIAAGLLERDWLWRVLGYEQRFRLPLCVNLQ